jgi:predicted nucleic acid-binding protein
MSNAITNTSPLLYLYRADAIEWLPQLFEEIWTPQAVVEELKEGMRRGYNVPVPEQYEWLKVTAPRTVPSEWLTLDLGMGELETMALALENTERIVILDDALARRMAQAAGIKVWGTLKVLLEAKAQGLTESIQPEIDRLREAGMWISDEIRQRVLALAGEQK